AAGGAGLGGGDEVGQLFDDAVRAFVLRFERGPLFLAEQPAVDGVGPDVEAQGALGAVQEGAVVAARAHERAPAHRAGQAVGIAYQVDGVALPVRVTGEAAPLGGDALQLAAEPVEQIDLVDAVLQQAAERAVPARWALAPAAIGAGVVAFD